MLNTKDREKLTKASQCVNLLVQDLRDLVKADNPLLADMAMEMLQQGVQLETKLKRILSLAKEDKASR